MNLLTLTVNKNDTTSYYRANGPFYNLKKQMDINITSMDFRQLNDMSWATLFLYDAVFFQRPYTNTALQLAEYCKKINLPIWMDYDDNLFAVTSDNPGFDIWSDPKIKSNMNSLIQLADVVTVSTPTLKQAFAQLNSNIVVIPNAVNLDLLRFRNIQKTNKTMLWRGSSTHQLDLMVYADVIYSAAEKYTDWKFTFFGYNGWFIPQTPNREYIKSLDPSDYFLKLHEIAPRAMHIPLADTPFNRCKSNIAFIEGTFAGAVCLVPDWSEWQLPGTLKYKNPAEYLENLELLLNEKVNFKKYNANAWEYITDNLNLPKINRQRRELLLNLVPKTTLKSVK